MARVVMSVYMVRYPLGGMLSWALQYALGVKQLGHNITLIEKADYANACFDSDHNEMGDDPACGLRIAKELLSRYGLQNNLAFVDLNQRIHGMDKEVFKQALTDADLYIDCGNQHDAWARETESIPQRVLIDGEPGYTQIRWQNRIHRGEAIPVFDHYFTNGILLGTPRSSAPTAGTTWRHAFNPVVPDLFDTQTIPAPKAPFTTVMNWRAHGKVDYNGVTYGQKDVEFEKFITLPSRVNVPMSIAIAGQAPRDQLKNEDWYVQEGHEVTASFDRYRQHIHQSYGEFSVCKNVFVALHTGWFSDRSAAYLASGRPVVMQDTGFSEVLPTGEGLFAVNNIDEAAQAIETIRSNYLHHAKAAKAIAREYLSATKVMGQLMDTIQISK